MQTTKRRTATGRKIQELQENLNAANREARDLMTSRDRMRDERDSLRAENNAFKEQAIAFGDYHLAVEMIEALRCEIQSYIETQSVTLHAPHFFCSKRLNADALVSAVNGLKGLCDQKQFRIEKLLSQIDGMAAAIGALGQKIKA